MEHPTPDIGAELVIEQKQEPAKVPFFERSAPKRVAKPEPEYDANEFADNPGTIGYSRDVVTAALDFAKIERCTLTQAKTLVKRFAEREA